MSWARAETKGGRPSRTAHGTCNSPRPGAFVGGYGTPVTDDLRASGMPFGSLLLAPEAVGQTLGARKSCAFVITRPLRAESFRSRNALVAWLCGSHAVGDIACCRSRTSRNLCPASPRS